jgi:small-conductance mechanosensitive channel
MLNNMVSHIDHVVMNHQNQTQTNGIRGHVCYIMSFGMPIVRVARSTISVVPAQGSRGNPLVCPYNLLPCYIYILLPLSNYVSFWDRGSVHLILNCPLYIFSIRVFYLF